MFASADATQALIDCWERERLGGGIKITFMHAAQLIHYSAFADHLGKHTQHTLIKCSPKVHQD